MSTPNLSVDKNHQQPEPIEDRVDMLLQELALAVKWQRPSILLAIYASELVCAEAQLMLEKKVAELGQKVSRLKIRSEATDIPLLLSRSPEREKTVFFVKSLRLDQKKRAGQLAYRALNIRRELLVDYRIRVVFWITEQEAADLPLHAPDFWAFRHRVIEFLDQPVPERVAALAESLALDGDHDETVQAFKKALKLDPKNVNVWSSLGDIYSKLDKIDNALQAFRKATRLDPKNADLLVRLGHIYRKMERIADARKAYKTALKLEPNNSAARAAMASVTTSPNKNDKVV